MADEVLLESATVNGPGSQHSWLGGSGLYFVYGDFGGGTCTLECTLQEIEWLSLGVCGELTSNGVVGFWLPPCSIRANLTGATSPNLNAIVRRQ